MSYGYEIITYGSGKVLALLFNGIAATVGDNNYTTLIRLSALLGIMWTLLESTFKNSFSLNVRWFIGFVLLYNVLLVPKVTVHVIDRVHHDEMRAIDNMPWGLAMFASLSSQVGDNLTRLTEKVFSLPEDLRYSKTGTVMASSVITQASQFHITNPDFAKNIREYMQQCVFYDVLLGKYSIQELMDATDIWGLINQTASPARAFIYVDAPNIRGHILTCKDGVQRLNQTWKQELEQASLMYGSRLFPHAKTPLEAKASLLSYLNDSYSYLTTISDNATQFMQQNMLANAFEQSLVGQGAQVNAPAAIHAYAVTRANEMKRSTYQITGDLAARWLPLMKNVFEAMFYGSFLFIFLVMLLPNGVSILQNYIFSLFWIQSWAPLYAILNLIMTLDAKSHSLTATTFANGNHALTLSTISGLSQVNSDTAALAGYLSMSIPFIAYGLVKGGAQTFTQLASSVGGVGQSVASTAAQESTTGNFSFGNTHFDTHSANNTSANHLNTNASVESGMTSFQTDTGAMIHHTPGGYDVIDNRGTTISNTATTVNLADSLRASVAKQYDESMTHAQQQTQSSAESLSTAIRNLNDLSVSHGSTTSTDDTYGISQSSTTSKSISQTQELNEQFAKSHGLTTSQSAQVLGSAYASVNLGIPINSLLGAGANANIGLIGKSEAQKQEMFQDATNFVTSTKYSENVETALRGIHDQHYRTSSDEGHRSVESISNSVDKANTYRQEASTNLQKAESLRQTLSMTNEKAANINQLATQEFVEWLKEKPAPGNTTGRMGASIAEHVLNHEPEIANTYANEFIHERGNALLSTLEKQPDSSHHSSNGLMKNSNEQENPQEKIVQHSSFGLGNPPPSKHNIMVNQANQLMAETNRTIVDKETLLSTQNNQIEQAVKNNSDRNPEGLLKKAVHNTVDTIQDTFNRNND